MNERRETFVETLVKASDKAEAERKRVADLESEERCECLMETKTECEKSCGCVNEQLNYGDVL